MKKLLKLVLIITILSLTACKVKDNKKENNKEDEFMEKAKINITINNTNFTATLEDNETTKELLKRLPLDITMNELNGNEKYYYFENSLPSNQTNIEKINIGDIMLYGDNCLVLFYDTFNTNYKYTKIGKLDNIDNLKNIVGKSNIKVYIK